jgi:type IV pilus assembly protein PilX
LVIGLILMTLLSLLALTAMGTSLLEERMAANARDRIRALQAAEAALRLCEQAARTAAQSEFTASGGTGGLYDALDPNRWQANWAGWSTAAPAVRLHAGLPLVDQPPRCIAERLGYEINETPGAAESLRQGQAVETERTYRHYRITALGWGQSPRTVVLLQSHARWLQD